MNINQPSKGESGINAILARNIETLLEKRRREERRANTQQKVADAITRFAGSVPFGSQASFIYGRRDAPNRNSNARRTYRVGGILKSFRTVSGGIL